MRGWSIGGWSIGGRRESNRALDLPRAAVVLIAVAWIALYSWQAQLNLMATIPHFVVPLAVLAWWTLAVWAVGPVLRGEPIPAAQAWLTSMGGLVVAATCFANYDLQIVIGQVTQRADQLWQPGAVGVLVGGLVFGRQLLPGIVLAAGTAVLTVAYASVSWVSPASVVATALLPLALCTVGACFTRVAVTRGEQQLDVILGQRRSRSIRQAELQAVTSAAQERRRDLAERVAPVLAQLQSEHPPRPETRAEAARLASSLRDDLQARFLMRAEIRTMVASARARGVAVSISDDRSMPSEDAIASRARALIAAGLGAADSGEMVFRISPASGFTCVASGMSEGSLARVGEVLTAMGAEVEVADEILWSSLPE